MYKADHSGVSAANNFYTHHARVEKVKHGYVMTLKVEVKHGMVTKFQPVSLGIGSLSGLHLTKQNGKDAWTYQVHFKSLDQLKKQVQGSLRLSVPIANIHDRLFKVWFAFGVKNVAHSSTVGKELADADNNDSNDASASSTSNGENTQSKISRTKSQSKPDVKTKKVKTSNPKAKTPTHVAKVAPKKKTMATVAAVEYPFLPVIMGFVVFDAAIIGLAIYLRNKVLKGKK